MEWISQFDPLTYGVDAMRQVALRLSVPAQSLATLSLHPIATNLVIMVAFGVAFIVPAVWLFNKQD
jgi:ABC-type multidrug transport system permease subunit